MKRYLYITLAIALLSIAANIYQYLETYHLLNDKRHWTGHVKVLWYEKTFDKEFTLKELLESDSSD